MSGSPLNPGANQNALRFGLFELDMRAGELRRSGIKIKLQEQPFQILTMLLERPGEIVTREELQKRLWPGDTFVDFDLSLNSAVKKLRQALGDNSESPRFIETLYRRGYRFIGQVNGVAAPQPVPESPPASQGHNTAELLPAKARKSNHQLIAWSVPALLFLIAAAAWLTRPSPSPRIIGYTQVTHDSLHKSNLVTDGERIYFGELRGDHFGVAQVSVNGGESSEVALPFSNSGIADIAGDGSALLVVSFKDTQQPPPFWSLPLPTGSPQRLNDASGQAATWSSDRSRLVFAMGPDIYVANGNGSQPQRLARAEGTVSGLHVSPDGRKLRFEVTDPRNGSSALWEVSRDGSGMHALLPGWNLTPQECCGNWTPDGKYYVFQSLRDGNTNLWVLAERRQWFGGHAKPVQLTNGPLNFSSPQPSKDGKKVFAVGAQPRSELVRYNSGSSFSSYLPGISATDLAFSSDGQFVAYVSVPEETLWRSKLDGSERFQLTEPPLQAALPRWSPDGKQIAFMGRSSGKNWRTYLIASQGGTARDLLPGAEAGFDPNWSPDGKSVVLTLNEAGTPSSAPTGPGIAIVDVQTQNVSPLPSAAHLFSPRWAPDGKYIAAIADDSQKLVLFDRDTQQWTDLVSMPIGYPSWSHNGQYLYFDTTLTNDPALFRVRISDRKLERRASLKGLQRFWGQFGSWTGLAPDDSFLLVRDTSSQEIYALEWQLP